MHCFLLSADDLKTQAPAGRIWAKNWL